MKGTSFSTGYKWIVLVYYIWMAVTNTGKIVEVWCKKLFPDCYSI